MPSTPGKLELNVPALLERLSDSLYDRPHVAVRELIQNAHDAIVLLQANPNFASDGAYRGEVGITLARMNGRPALQVQDNGVGMTDEDLRRELSVIGQSQKPEQLEDLIKHRGQDTHRLIGQYGIGFLAAFLVGVRIDVFTRKVGSVQGYHWWCEGSEYYYIEPHQCDFVHGTKVMVTLKPSEKLPSELVEIDGLKKVARDYAALLPVPVYVKDARVNRYADNWLSRNRFKEAREEDLREFLQESFPTEFLDLFRVDAKFEHAKYGEIQYRGAFLIGQIALTDFLLLNQQDKKSGGLDVYVRGMYVCRSLELMPSWASFVHGAVDVANLNLGLSRETIRRDEIFEAVQADLGRRVIHRLHDLKGSDKIARIIDMHSRHLFAACVLHGARKFGDHNQTFLDDMSGMLPFPTTHGPMTILSYLRSIEDASERFRQCSPKTIYCLMQKTSGIGESMLAEDMGWPVMLVVPVERKVLDAYVSQHSDIALRQLAPDDLFALGRGPSEGDTSAPLLRALFEEQLSEMHVSGVEARVKAFRPGTPALLLLEGEQDQDFDRLINEIVARSGPAQQNSAIYDVFRKYSESKKRSEGKRYLYVNSANRIVQLAVELLQRDSKSDAVRLACRTIYNSAFLQSAHAALDRRNASIVVENFYDTLQRVLELSLTAGETKESVTEASAEKRPENSSSSVMDTVEPELPYILFVHTFRDSTVQQAVAAAKSMIEKEFKIKALSADEEVRALTVPENVKALIRGCRIAVADISGNNPNVMLEIGMLDMLGKRVVKIRNAGDQAALPIDIGADLYCTYEAVPLTRDPTKVIIEHQFIDRIREHIRHALQ